MLGWFYLSLSIILELAGSTCMKLSEGFTKKLPSVFVFVFYGTCFYFFSLALKTIELSVAYAIWGGVGTVAVSIIGVIALKEPIGLIKAVSIGMIAVGVIILELVP
ncbi:DMT family transporter [Iningainema tapete]|uniref:Multidrug efflux SMR transporter n=1 Tax=Iningainema tapete BLCC-T55 TaxID=2748662 RepID=A0A8J6XIL2_9CYAN|nr:multidrug efflux SMR transporter [Iningainema tapete]MBD2773051.1 multidrug efflux SMR transporter [Iningainema tapete BLCC-T55]